MPVPSIRLWISLLFVFSNRNWNGGGKGVFPLLKVLGTRLLSNCEVTHVGNTAPHQAEGRDYGLRLLGSVQVPAPHSQSPAPHPPTLQSERTSKEAEQASPARSATPRPLPVRGPLFRELAGQLVSHKIKMSSVPRKLESPVR